MFISLPFSTPWNSNCRRPEKWMSALSEQLVTLMDQFSSEEKWKSKPQLMQVYCKSADNFWGDHSITRISVFVTLEWLLMTWIQATQCVCVSIFLCVSVLGDDKMICKQPIFTLSICNLMVSFSLGNCLYFKTFILWSVVLELFLVKQISFKGHHLPCVAVCAVGYV